MDRLRWDLQAESDSDATRRVAGLAVLVAGVLAVLIVVFVR